MNRALPDWRFVLEVICGDSEEWGVAARSIGIVRHLRRLTQRRLGRIMDLRPVLLTIRTQRRLRAGTDPQFDALATRDPIASTPESSPSI